MPPGFGAPGAGNPFAAAAGAGTADVTATQVPQAKADEAAPAKGEKFAQRKAASESSSGAASGDGSGNGSGQQTPSTDASAGSFMDVVEPEIKEPAGGASSSSSSSGASSAKSGFSFTGEAGPCPEASPGFLTPSPSTLKGVPACRTAPRG